MFYGCVIRQKRRVKTIENESMQDALCHHNILITHIIFHVIIAEKLRGDIRFLFNSLPVILLGTNGYQVGGNKPHFEKN